MVNDFDPFGIIFAKPKSVSTAYPEISNRIFSGFKSLQQTTWCSVRTYKEPSLLIKCASQCTSRKPRVRVGNRVP